MPPGPNDPLASSRAALTMQRPSAMAGSTVVFSASDPIAATTSAAKATVSRCGEGTRNRPKLLVERVEREEAPCGPSKIFGEPKTEPSTLGHLVPQVGLVADPVGLERSDDVDRASLREERVSRLLELELLGVEGKVDGHRFSLAG